MAITASSLTPDMIQVNYPYTSRIIGGDLSSATQYGDRTTLSTGNTSTGNLATILSSTISWPGLDGEYLDEVEFSLVTNYGYSTDGATLSTVGVIWQIKNQSETTWTDIASFTGASTASTALVTHSGYRLHRDSSLTTGYNRLPLNLRLRAYVKKGSTSDAKVRVSKDSYVTMKTRKGNDVP